MKKILYTIGFTIVVLSVLVISFTYFIKFENEVDNNNVYYIFSTSAQTLAALVGFVLTAYIFTYQNLRNIKEDDETLTEIIEITIENYYRYIFLLSFYTAVVLIADILLLQLNIIESWPYKSVVFLSIAMANILGIIIAFAVALYILRPFREKSWARSIFKDEENKDENENENENENETVTKDIKSADNEIEIEFTVQNSSKDVIDTMNFIKKFIELEGIIRDYTNENFQFNDRTTLRKRLNYLGATQKLSPNIIEDLLVIIKYRNLAVHGHIPSIERKVYNDLVKVLEEVKKSLQ